MSSRNYFIFWGLAFLALMGLFFVFKGVLLPFILGTAVAYLLNPVVNWLGNHGLPRGLATLSILLGFLLIAAGTLIVLSPLIYQQLVELSEDIPSYVDQLWAVLQPYSLRLQEMLGQESGQSVEDILRQHSGAALNVANGALSYLASGSQSVLSALSVVVFMPLVAYFMMKEWVHITNWVSDIVPRGSKKDIMSLLKEIDQKLSAFVRGQISVAVILGVVYAIALSVIGLKYGFLIGLSAGLLSIIPMVGSIVGLLAGVIVAWFQSGELSFVALVAGVFVVGQILEGNVLTPKIVGKSVGLHPLWIFFALLAGGSLFGIIGMLIAVPVAAVVSVLLSFGIKQYKAGPYYKAVAKPVKKPTRKKKTKKA